MKNLLRTNEEIAPPLTGGAMLHLDGQCFPGARGTLAVALSENALRWLASARKPTHWLLPLEASWLPGGLDGLDGEILWVSTRAPEAVVGALNENIRGAWLEGGEAVLCLDGLERRLRIQQMPSAAFIVPYLARLAADEWLGRTGEGLDFPSPFPAPGLKNEGNSYEFAA